MSSGDAPRVHVDAGGPGPIRSRVAARLIDREEIGGCVRIRLRVPGWPGAQAGRFALLQAERSHFFLPRPYSVHFEGGYGEEGRGRGSGSPEDVDFLVDPVGPASRELCRVRPGEWVWVLGPLGRGFDLAEMCAQPGAVGSCPAAGVGRPRPRMVVVAGGVGLAPFPLLLAQVARMGERGEPSGGVFPSEVLVLAGFADTKRAAVIETCGSGTELLRRHGIPSRVRVVTEDGSVGPAGLVTELLVGEVCAGDRVAACGPHAMAEAVWRICTTAGASAWFSLEARMACGVGSCHGCVMHVGDGRLVRVCRSGPVMSGEEAFGAIDTEV